MCIRDRSYFDLRTHARFSCATVVVIVVVAVAAAVVVVVVVCGCWFG